MKKHPLDKVNLGTIFEYLHLGEIGFLPGLEGIGRFGIGTSNLLNGQKAYRLNGKGSFLCLVPFSSGLLSYRLWLLKIPQHSLEHFIP